ncbi:MAG: hypothetical protein JXB48_24045 [Candidatus Latescibacteria bacterium]|nr:hypothetical protein [Candidatus Latescibacterota bacterium]
MNHPMKNLVVFFIFCIMQSGIAVSAETGLIRTIPVDTPKKSVLRISNSTFYSKIKANDILIQRYGVTKSHIISSLTDIEFGITDYFAIVGSLPYYADLFKQGNRSGEKTGGGDIAAGFRFAYVLQESMFRGISFGSRFLIPEKLVYGQEPLGFRVFTSGELGYSIEGSLGLNLKYLDGYASMAMQKFPKSPAADIAYPQDVFYDTGFGYRGIGVSDQTGYAPTLFQDQIHVSFCGIAPLKSWLAIFAEYSSTAFTSRPQREEIERIAPGLRIGKPDKFNASIGIDIAMSGPIPDKTFLFRLHIPSVSPRGIKEALGGIKKVPDLGKQIRSKNTFVGITDFEKSDLTYLYEKELRDSFQKQLDAFGVLKVVPGKKVDTALHQQTLIPVKDTPTQLGVRMGAGYIINTDISDYNVTRTSSFTIPLVIGFPQTDFSIKARASVTDLVTGEKHDLGIISATVYKKRGVNLFPYGASSDIDYLSEPERRVMEKELVDLWVKNFNDRINERLDLFDWDPKRTILRGDEDVSG